MKGDKAERPRPLTSSTEPRERLCDLLRRLSKLPDVIRELVREKEAP